MKINWGTGLVIGMIAFMGFIMYLVVNMMTDDKFDHDLVTEEYYQKDLYYQQEIDAETQYNALGQTITGKRTAEGWELQFPAKVTPTGSDAKVNLYRPSNKKLDSELPLVLDQNKKMLIPAAKMVDGIWKVQISWMQDEVPYLYKETIVY